MQDNLSMKVLDNLSNISDVVAFLLERVSTLKNLTASKMSLRSPQTFMDKLSCAKIHTETFVKFNLKFGLQTH